MAKKILTARSVEHWLMRSDARAVGGQAARFLIAGGFLTILSAAIYWCTVRIGVEPLLASIIGHLVGLLIGYRLHARWTFAGTSGAARGSAENLRFVLVSLSGLLCNLFWVELLVHAFAAPDWTPIAPMVFVTPALTFAINRSWVFGGTARS
jgi:putative flippase GtrA